MIEERPEPDAETRALLARREKNLREKKKQYRQFFDRAEKNAVLKRLPALHDRAFANIDCLNCGQCCKNYSPRFKAPDIRRISRSLKMKKSAFIETYLRLDEDGDYVVTTKPCPFLEPDNRCRIYENRPSDCARFPYTDEDVFIKRKQITLKNLEFCPIVYVVTEWLEG